MVTVSDNASTAVKLLRHMHCVVFLLSIGKKVQTTPLWFSEISYGKNSKIDSAE